jgi:hypothetical protein
MAGDAAFAYASAIRQLEFPASGSVDAISEYFEIERANLSSGWASDAAKAADLAANAAEWAYLSYAANAAVSRAEAAARAARFTAATARADAASVAASAEAEAAKGRANAVAGRIAVEAVKVASLATKVLYFQEEIRTDIATIHKSGFMDAADSPLWSRADNREQSNESMAALQAVLPQGEDWEVWINWYEERLRGGSRGEVYELVFASVPLDEWDKGPAAANGWIKAHLPK